MSNSIKPWSTCRQVLWLVAVLGLLFLWGGLFLAFMFRGGFGPGNQTSPPGLIHLVGVTVCSSLGVYYLLVAHRVWTRSLLRVGLVIHGGVVAFLIAGGVASAIPAILIWALVWIVYAKRNPIAETSA